MLKFCRVFILTFVLLVGLFIQQGYCTDRYYWLDSSDTTSFSLDTQTFNVSRDNNWIYLNVWIEYKYNEAGIEKEISIRKKAELSTAGYEKLSYSLKHFIYAKNQSRKMYKLTQLIYYDIDGNVLDNITLPASDRYVEAIPGSVGEHIEDKVFDYYFRYKKLP